MRRFSFLPAFFTFLAAAFAVAVGIRVHSYQQPSSRIASMKTESGATTQATAATERSVSGTFSDDPGTVVNTPASIGTIVDAQPATPPAASLREQRYRELLNASKNGGASAAAHPAATAAPGSVEEKPSLFQRVVAPIVKAFGGGSGSNSAPRAVAAAPARNATNASSSSSSNQEKPGRDTGDKTNQKEDPKDPNSDVTAPQLLSVQFDPPTVQDGQETVLAITANDDISGVRTISGNIISPGGALQGFALQKEGETNRFVSRVLVPKDAAEGAWHVNYLNLTDNANNSVTLSWQQGALPATAQFRVTSSSSDTTAPTLKAVWLDRQTMRTGEKDLIYVQADDDKSGVNLVSGVFLSPSKFARIGFGCRAQNGNVWECDVTPPGNADCGDWQLEQVQLQDKANNMAAIRSDNPVVGAVKLNIQSDRCDSQPPVIQTVSLDNSVITAPGAATISVVATDDSSGVASISGHFVFTGKVAPGNQPPRIYFSCRPSGDPSTNIWQGPVAVAEKTQAKGLYKIGSIQVLDKANNLKLYQANDPVVANVVLQIR